jgi:hypothetical protein
MSRASVLLLSLCTSLALAAQPRAQVQNPPQPASNPPTAGEPKRLQLGIPIERELHGGETHIYKIHVAAGQFVHAVVMQEGIDVAVTLRDPGGKEVATSDSLNGAYGPERVSAIAEIAGDFRLEVAAGNSPPGRYDVRVTDLRAPTQADRTRMEAEQVYMEGISLYAEQKDQSYKAAAEKWQVSSRLWQSLGDQYGQALSLLNSCTASMVIRALDTALGCFCCEL